MSSPYARVFTARVKVAPKEMSQVCDRRRRRGLFKPTNFFAFFAQLYPPTQQYFGVKWSNFVPKLGKSLGHATLHSCRVEECRGPPGSHGKVVREGPASIEPNHAHDQRDLNIVTQKTDPKVSCLHTLTYTKEHLKLTCQFQTATCKVHRLNPLYFLRHLGLLSCSPGKTNAWKKPDLLDKLNAKRG